MARLKKNKWMFLTEPAFSLQRRLGQFVVLLFISAILIVAIVGGGLFYYANKPLSYSQLPVQFELKAGGGLRSAIAQMQDAGALGAPAYVLPFQMLGRLRGDAEHVQAGVYEIDAPITPLALLKKITSGDQAMDRITLIEGWTFAQARSALDASPSLRHDTKGLSDDEIARQLNIGSRSPEGWLFPDTYVFVKGSSDLIVLRQAYRTMHGHLTTLWQQRASNLPLETPYQALTLASIIEKETGTGPDERAMIAAVFINRLKRNMMLQTDPTVIYGIGSKFDGNLRKRDLLKDTPYNTYTRYGLPPTPIALPGLASLQVALHPADSKVLYFVARGDGASYFSTTLAEHQRAVVKYQLKGKPLKK